MNKAKIFFRADGDSKIGLGHVIRSTALAEMLCQHFECIFLIRPSSKDLINEIKKSGSKAIVLPFAQNYEVEALDLPQRIDGLSNSVVVLDGYSFDTTYQQILKNNGCILVSIDDIHQCFFVSNVVVNHSISAKRNDYSSAAYTKFFFGPDFALIRSVFRKNAFTRNKNSFKWNRNIFVSLGGADPNNELFKVLSSLQNVFDSNIFVVVGSAYKYYKELLCHPSIINKSIKVLKGLSELEMLKLMQRCGIAICSPSSVAIEFMAVGGLLFLHCIADNQKEFFLKAIELEIAFPFDAFPTLINEFAGQKMFDKHCILIDGKQEERYLSIFKNIFYGI